MVPDNHRLLNTEISSDQTFDSTQYGMKVAPPLVQSKMTVSLPFLSIAVSYSESHTIDAIFCYKGSASNNCLVFAQVSWN